MIDWNDADARARLRREIGHKEYMRAVRMHIDDCKIMTVGGHAIWPEYGPFGVTYHVGMKAFSFDTLELAMKIARANPAIMPTPQNE